ncbi:MAG: penicillin-binding transpeptidase domain-containing protein [Pyrinomonadaceae bacterium]
MHSMCPDKRLAKLSFSLFLAVLLLFPAGSSPAQSRQSSAARKAAAKKDERQARDAKKVSTKDSKREQLAKHQSRNDDKRDRASASSRDDKRESRSEKLADRAKDKRSDREDRKDSKRTAERRRIEAERRAAEEARRQAALAEQRRREELAREARARRIAFERSLRTETVANIENDSTEGEDPNIRRAAVGALGSRAGTVVVMEAKTGKVLTIVNQDWAIRNAFKPCSTIKLVTGVAGINEHVINEDGHIGNSNGMVLQDALAHSNNAYFQRVGSNLGGKKMVEYAQTLGLGEPTGLNMAGETGGRVPHGNNNARIYSHGDDFEVTPLQLAVLVSELSNGGQKVVPQVPRPRTERTAFRQLIAEHVNLPDQTMRGVLPGMIGAAEYGTARKGVDASMGVAGKTGSCITKGTWIGLFASVAPVEDPKYSVVVITRGESERGKYAAAVAGRVYQALGSQIKPSRELRAAIRGGSRPDLDARSASRTDEDEDEAAAGGDENDGSVPVTVARGVVTPAAPAEKKLIQRTTQSKPSFSPVVIEFDRSGAEKTRPRIVKNK